MPSRMDEELKTARAVLGLLATEAGKAELALTEMSKKLKDEGLALAVIAQVKALRLAADEARGGGGG